MDGSGMEASGAGGRSDMAAQMLQEQKGAMVID